MSHSHSNSLLLEPNKRGEIIWKFSTNKELEIACNVPGHYQAGMVSAVSIN
ncbi:copper-binding protein [Candidatus Pelagibacter sp. IMCC9063]|nr:copper-binding protein [Candidatus Pelagibacter sp. IMCC9063]